MDSALRRRQRKLKHIGDFLVGQSREVAQNERQAQLVRQHADARKQQPFLYLRLRGADQPLVELGQSDPLAALAHERLVDCDPVAPELSGVDPITGKQVRLSDYEGRPVVINVWASWCAPCHDEAPDLARFARAHPEAQLIGIDIRDAESPARAFYRRYGWRHPSIFDPSGEKAASLGLQGQPITYFLNERHEIVETIPGASDFAGFEAGLELAKES